MKEYKGYRIEKITAKDWIAKNKEGKMILTAEHRVPRTLKEAKEAVDHIEDLYGRIEESRAQGNFKRETFLQATINRCMR